MKNILVTMLILAFILAMTVGAYAGGAEPDAINLQFARSL